MGVASSSSCSPACLVNPCHNGGSFEPLFPTGYVTPRFKCNCPPGYAGNLCQHEVKSCRGYNNGSRIPGKYKIFDDNMELFDVFCDFDLNSTNAWTLIQSYEFQNKKTFAQKIFPMDFAVNSKSPRWDAYRLSKFRMQSIQEDSSKFRVTCNYDTDGVVYRDYLQVATDQIDILTYASGASCILVEQIDIRGESCKNCTAHIFQNFHHSLHSDSYFPASLNCEFQPTGGLYCSGYGEDNFGFYDCANPAHRCSSAQSSTTQTWFGRH